VTTPAQLETWRKGTIKYRKKNKEKGLCRYCPRPIFKHDCCEYHYQIKLVVNRAGKKRKIEKNLCPRCGQPLIEEEIGLYQHCMNCRSHISLIKIYETTLNSLS